MSNRSPHKPVGPIADAELAWANPEDGLWVPITTGHYSGIIERSPTGYRVIDPAGQPLGEWPELRHAQRHLQQTAIVTHHAFRRR